MKKIIKAHSLQTLALYAVIYFCYSFINWSFVNPVQWIIDIPLYDKLDRFTILFFFVMYHALSLFAWHSNKIK